MNITYQLGFVSYFVDYNAPNKLFRKSDERKKWTDEQKEKWFSHFWTHYFLKAVLESEIIASDVARNQLGLTNDDKRATFFKDEMQHRLVRYEDMTFIIQLEKRFSDNLQVNQIWVLSSRDFDPLKICVTFPTEESKKRFISLTTDSDKYGNRLLELLVQNYMREHGQNW